MAYLFLLLGILDRVLPHDWNFSVYYAAALFGGAYLARHWAVALPIFSLFASDCIRQLVYGDGFYSGMPLNYLSLYVFPLLGLYILRKRRERLGLVLGTSFVGAIAFFLLSNFWVWFGSSMYSHSFSGLIDCYVKGLPFFRNSFFSTLGFSFAFFGIAKLMKVSAAEESQKVPAVERT